MLSYPNSYDKNSLGFFKCAVCRSEILNNSNIYQCGLGYGIVCDDCFKRFSSDDIELVLNMFIAYGGFFGKYSLQGFSVEKFIYEAFREVGDIDDNAKVRDLSVRLLHKALLYGVTPKVFSEKLEEFLKK